MPPIKLSTRIVSEAFWERILEAQYTAQIGKLRGFSDCLSRLDKLRSGAAYNTGTIGLASAWLLYAMCRYFHVQGAIEIGTFIGRSTTAIALAIADEGGGLIYTCDKSNSIEIPSVGGCTIKQHKKCESVDMLRQMVGQAEQRMQFIYLDGTLGNDDPALLDRLARPEAIIALDDFEGIEKGVMNAVLLGSTSFGKTHLLLYPPTQSILTRFGFADRSTMAVMVPRSSLRFSRQ